MSESLALDLRAGPWDPRDTEERVVSKTYVNVETDQAGEERIQAEEQSWTSMKLVVLGLIFLPICLAILYSLANLTTWLGIHQP